MSDGGARAAAPAADALPQFFEFEAPREWKAIDFVSDLHLSAATPRTVAALRDELVATDADAVFILGDLFDVWVGDDAVSLPFESRCLEMLADGASRRTVGLMVGNRDFLFGSSALKSAGLLGLSDPTLLLAWGQRVLLSHGDALCLDDHAYQAFRSRVRGEDWQREFLSRPLAERVALASAMRRESGERQRAAGHERVDLDTAETVRWMHAIAAPELVHGHTHRPGSETLAPGYKRHVLSDWDLDDADRAEVLRLTRDGFERIPPRGAGGSARPDDAGSAPAAPDPRRPRG